VPLEVTARVWRRDAAFFDELAQLRLLLAEAVKRLFDAHEALFVVVPLNGHGPSGDRDGQSSLVSGPV